MLGARSRHHQDQEEAEATKLVAELDRDGPRHPTGPGPSCDITATQAEHGTRDFAARHDQFLTYFFMSGSCVKPPNTLPCLSAATPSGISSFGSGAGMKAVTLPSLTLPMRMPCRNGGFTFSFDCASRSRKLCHRGCTPRSGDRIASILPGIFHPGRKSGCGCSPGRRRTSVRPNPWRDHGVHRIPPVPNQ